VALWEKSHGLATDEDKKAAEKKGGKKPAPKAVAKKDDKKKGGKDVPGSELDKNVADALFNAALYHEGLGEDAVAIAAYTKYVEYCDKKLPGFDKKNDSPEVFLGIARIHAKNKQWKDAVDTYQAYATRYGKEITASQAFQAKYKQFVALREIHPPTASGGKFTEDHEVGVMLKDLIAAFGKLDEKGRGDGENFNAYGHLRFLALEPLWREYVAINLKDTKHVLPDLKTKFKLIKTVEDAYTEVVATHSGEWGIAALTRVGLAYEDFARDLLDSPDPKGLNDDQLQMYRAELENKAFPLEDKSVEHLEAALAKSTELHIYSDWTLKAQDQLNKIRPGAFLDARQVGFRGSEFFKTAPAILTAEAPAPAPTTAPAPAPATAPAPAAGNAAPAAPAPASKPAAGAGGN
jgi:hypothetical protein